MLRNTKQKTLENLLSSASKEELIWINGYISGFLKSDSKETPGQTTETPVLSATRKITIVYGTETGNSKSLANSFSQDARQYGHKVKVKGLDQYRLSDLEKEEYLLIIMSTHGDGEPPEAAKKFWEHIFKKKPGISGLKFSVLALGDSAYPLFCQAGTDIDRQLEELGGERLFPLVKCDVDFEGDARSWFENLSQKLNGGPEIISEPSLKREVKSGGRKNYSGRILSNINLNGRGSNKATYHIEIESEDVEYQPGDALGIKPFNDGKIVESILQSTGLNPGHSITYRDASYTVEKLLKEELNVLYLPERVVRKYAEITGHTIPDIRIDLYELLRIYPVEDEQQFLKVLEILEPVSPRLYSISSSSESNEGEVHLTICRDSFQVHGKKYFGHCSHYLTALGEDSEIEFYIHPNRNFRLPDDDKPIVMIGPGTGIAPFRSFLLEREVRGASGKNWLFFGEQHFTTDFLYQTEIQDWVNSGILNKVSLAFSRDQKEKIYVQDRLLEQREEFIRWLDEGAHVYICGDKNRMSKDVEKAVLQIFQEHKSLSEESAEAYLNELKETGRYVLDVY